MNYNESKETVLQLLPAEEVILQFAEECVELSREILVFDVEADGRLLSNGTEYKMLSKVREEAADVVQETFLKYWNKHTDFDDYRKIKSFLYVVVRHACLNLLRDRELRSRIPEEWIEDSEQEFRNQVMEEEVHRIFNHAIDKLPLQMRMVINLSLDGLKNSEIAEKMNLSEGTVHAYKKEAYKKLRISLKDYYYLLPFLLFISR